jgi:hypothetical protein
MSDSPTPDSTRRGGVPARPIRLADGNDWAFATPTVRLIPRVETHPDLFGRSIEKIVVDLDFGYPPAIQSLLDVMWSNWEVEPVSSQYEAFFSLAGALLLRAHEISFSTACELLTLPDHELSRLVGEVLAVVAGGKEYGGAKPRGDIDT